MNIKTTSSIRQGPVESNSHHTMESINSASSPGLEFSKEVWVDYSKEDIVRIFMAVYEKIVYWRKKYLMLATGAAGKSYIEETTRLINHSIQNQ